MRKPNRQPKVSTKRSTGQSPFLSVLGLIFVAAIVAGLAFTGNLTAEAVTALGAVTTALVALIHVTKK